MIVRLLRPGFVMGAQMGLEDGSLLENCGTWNLGHGAEVLTDNLQGVPYFDNPDSFAS